MKKLLIALLAILPIAAFGDVLRTVSAGSTDVSVDLKIIDSTDGTPETGVVFNTSGIDLEYCRDKAACVDITEADLTTPALTDAHADGGFLAKGHGNYRLDLPDAAVASGVEFVTIQGTVTGMIVIGGIVELVAYDPQDGVRAGLTALPNAAADAAGGLPISDAGGLDLDAMNVNVNDIETDTADMQPKLGTPIDFGSGTSTLAANLQDLADNGTATFDRSTDSLQALRDRGDAAWTTGSGAGLTAIASGTAQSATGTTLVLASGETFADDELIGAVVHITGGSTGLGQPRCISDNVGSTDTITVPTWTTTPTGTITYEIAPSLGGECPLSTGSATTLNVTASGNVGIDWANVENATSTVGLSGTTVSTVSTLTGHTAQTGDNYTRLGAPAGASVSADVAAVKADTAATLSDTAEIAAIRARVDALAMHGKLDAAFLNCEVNTANFAGSTTTLACILTDRDGGAVTQANNDLEGLQLVVTSGAQIREQRFIVDSTWDGTNSELRVTLSRALPGTLADAVTAVIR